MMTKCTSVGLANRSRGLVAILVLGLLAWGCGDGGIGGQESPTIEMPDTLHFGQEASERTFTIENIGSGELQIHSIGVENDVGEAFSEAGDGWPDSMTIEPDEREQLTVEFDPVQEVDHEGRVVLDHNDTDGAESIDLQSAGLGAELFVDPSPVEFPQTPAGSEDWQVAEVRNIGESTLEIEDIQLTQGEADFSLTFFEDPGDDGFPSRDQDLSEPPQEAMTLEDSDDVLYMRVLFEPEDEAPKSGEIQITHTVDQVETVDLSGNSGDTCLEVADGDTLEFGPSAINELNLRTLTMRNCSPEAELNIFDLSLTDDGGDVFSLDDDDLPGALPGGTEVLEPGEAATTMIGYTPEEETSHTGELLIESDDAHEPDKYVELTGEGVDADCPVAVAEGKVGPTAYGNPVYAANQDVVDMRGDESSDPDGTDLSYEWTILDQPSGSTAVVEPSPYEANPEFEVDIVGNFQIELTVTDEYGLQNCEPAILEIDATPTGEIHVQLTWEAPEVQEQYGGPDPDAGIGTDLDIHYIHQDGSWDHPDTIYYLNMWEDWGEYGVAELDIDDLYGADPENITHTDPLDGAMYRIGIHYYCDNNFGPADATVRVYFGDALYTEDTRRLEATDHFWYMGNIQWDATEPTVQLMDDYQESMILSDCEMF